MRQAFEIAATLIMVGCAIAVLAMHADRVTPSRTAQADLSSASVVPDWREESEAGIWRGPADASTVITTFIDFTCPYCQRLAPVLDSLMLTHGDSLAVAFHHYPLGRPLSMPSAIAAECAQEQARFLPMARELYDHLASASDGEPDWLSLAERAGVPRLEEFQECTELPEDRFPRVLFGQELGRRTGVRGTPTVWLNGLPTAARDVAAFEALLVDS